MSKTNENVEKKQREHHVKSLRLLRLEKAIQTRHKNQKCFQDEEGNVHLTFESNQLQETLYWVLHFGAAVKIVGPEELKKLYREEVGKMAKGM